MVRHVRLKPTLLPECHTANCALERLLIGVHSHVRLQITLLGKRLSTDVAFERFFITVGKFVLRKPATAAELESAQCALVLVQPVQSLLVVD